MTDGISPALRVAQATQALQQIRNLFDRIDLIKNVGASLPIRVLYDRLDLALQPNLAIDIANLRIQQRSASSDLVAGDLVLKFADQALDPASKLHLRRPVVADLDSNDIAIDEDCLTLQLANQHINEWLRLFSADLADDGDPTPTNLALRIIYAGDQPELRIDWQPTTAAGRTFRLPGVRIDIPPGTRFSLVLASNHAGVFRRLGLIATLPGGQKITARSTLAWGRNGDRDLHNDDDTKRQPPDKPLLQLELSTTQSTSLVLIDLPIGGGSPLRFLRQLPLLEPISTTGTARCRPIGLDTAGGLSASDWKNGTLTVNSDGFQFPFLRQGGDQFIQVSAPASVTFDVSAQAISVPVAIMVKVKALELAGEIDFVLDLASFGLRVNHNQGIQLNSAQQEVQASMLGLDWTFTGAPVAGRSNRFHHLTLVTKDYNYQLVQPPGAALTISYDGISDEPLIFRVRDFKVGSGGISLTTTVDQAPITLRAINTRFNFRGSGFTMVDSRLLSFTLTGTGSLPPALVGDAQATIFLQFADKNGTMKLIEGKASLKGAKLLDCHATRFRFSIQELGIGFVEENNRNHLYFTITGNARFVLSPGDDAQGPLAWLPNIGIDLVECPLTGDASVISRHVRFLIELPRKLTFSFFGCFEMEVRSVGFLPQASMFDGDGAMMIGGQISFAQGEGDHKSDRPDYHMLYIGLPAPGEFFPRLHLTDLPARLSIGDAFTIDATISFHNEPTKQGFSGEGTVILQGLPRLDAAFAFVRVRENPDTTWLRAWFIALNVGRLSLLIPVVQIYIREIGFGFGYRYTLKALKVADETTDLRELIKKLDELSRTQGNITTRDSWAPDFGGPGDPRWTIVLRAMIAQSSASVGIGWVEAAEKTLKCLYLFEVVIAFRSDLTFYMAGRGWINTNYYSYDKNDENIRNRPLVSGYMLLQPRKPRFLARVVSNPNGSLGTNPKMPAFIEAALRSCSFSASLLVEPGLVHYELGWPDRLRWGMKFGPLAAEYRGGFIFRVTFRGNDKELLIGTNYQVSASLDFRAEVDLGVVGARLQVYAYVSYGARLIGALSLSDPFGHSMLYGRIHLEIYVRLTIEVWVSLFLFSFSGRISLGIGITASLELALNGIDPSGLGLRGQASLSFHAMGHDIGFSVNLGFGTDNVIAAEARTRAYMDMGLEAGDSPSIVTTPDQVNLLTAAESTSVAADATTTRRRAVLSIAAPARVRTFETPSYILFVIRPEFGSDGYTHFVLIPKGDPDETAAGLEAQVGFLPYPPASPGEYRYDYELSIPDLPTSGLSLEHYDRQWRTWDDPQSDHDPDGTLRWRVQWDAVIQRAENLKDKQRTGTFSNVELADFISYAFLRENGILVGDPQPLVGDEERIEDSRVYHAREDDYEAAVRGASEQFRSSPFFKVDTKTEYDRQLIAAFQDTTSAYSANGENTEQAKNFQAIAQIRGMIIHEIIADLRDYVKNPQSFDTSRSIAFQMGLVFRHRTAPANEPAWLTSLNTRRFPTIRQRLGPDANAPSTNDPARPVRPFNTPRTSFAEHPPIFGRVQGYSSATTIALAWDLTWDHLESGEVSRAAADPDHHLAYYEVRRRSLDSDERDLMLTIKSSEVLHRSQQKGVSLLQRLRTRFQVVDQFAEETAEDRAAIPPEGRRYLYTITPFDYAGAAGRPLTMIMTRTSDEPPLPPIEADLTIEYPLGAAQVIEQAGALTQAPDLITPSAVTLAWKPAPPRTTGPNVVIRTHRAIFRRSATLPIGSYGLDAITSGDQIQTAPASHARPLPTDIIIELPFPTTTNTSEEYIGLPIAVLREYGIIPAAEQGWRGDAWQVFIQAIGVNGVYSGLTPAEIVLKFTGDPTADGRLPQEERRLASLEWLPKPGPIALLAPEDQHAITGRAHVPRPKLARFAGSLDAIAFQPHPSGIQGIHMRWNRAPSTLPDFPAELLSGFRLYELDVDAHTTETFESAERLSTALRPIQEVQLLPGEDLLLEPADTLTTSRWEAWYPSTLQREQLPTSAAQMDEVPWYSWRESLLQWPEWAGLTTTSVVQIAPRRATRTRGVRDGAVHPLLRALITAMEQHQNDGMHTYIVDYRLPPPTSAATLSGFLGATPPAADPYGWRVLQYFGLAVAICLRDPLTRRPVSQKILLETLNQALNTLATTSPYREIYAGLKRHLSIELLFQPGKAIALSADAEVEPTQLLALVQVSLRPIVQQLLHYSELVVAGKPGDRVVLNITSGPISLINSDDPGAGEQSINEATSTSQFTLVLPRAGNTTLTGTTRLLLRYSNRPTITVVIPAGQDKPNATLSMVPYAASDPRAMQFLVSQDLAQDFTSTAALYSSQWEKLRTYIGSLSLALATDVARYGTKAQLEEGLPALLNWSMRFFNHGGEIDLLQVPIGDAIDLQGRTGIGPWQATAYPRPSTPAYVAPDRAGRLMYTHLISDRWAHLYRYYIQPYGRYDRLLATIRSLPGFGTNSAEAWRSPPQPAPNSGGLDVVIERTAAVRKPLILRSGRLDRPSRTDQPAPPDRTWEVIVARHAEQNLSDHNQTLARRLNFRQVAFTLLRRFQYDTWVNYLHTQPGGTLNLESLTIAQQIYPALPGIPTELDHLSLSGPASPNDPVAVERYRSDIRSIDLPIRVEELQQGVLALQWQALPFYYAHRLLLIAQAAGQVSDPNEVIQSDFEYRAPDPSAAQAGTQELIVLASLLPPNNEQQPNQPAVALRGRRVRLPLKRLWDSLPDEARQHWNSENPITGLPAKRTLSALPDPDVVYQLIEVFGGNIEVQAELFFAWPQEVPADAPPGTLPPPSGYLRRQLGRRDPVTDPRFVAATQPDTDYHLVVTVFQPTEVALTKDYTGNLANLPPTVAGRMIVEPKRVLIYGSFEQEDLGALHAIVEPLDRVALAQAYAAWDSSEVISHAAGNADQTPSVTYADFTDRTVLIWTGSQDAQPIGRLAQLPGDDEFRAALTLLASRASESVLRPLLIEAAPSLDQRPRDWPSQLVIEETASAYTSVAWLGLLLDDPPNGQFAVVSDFMRILAWSRIAVLSSALNQLLDAIEHRSVPVPLGAPRPTQADLPPLLQGHLQIGVDELGWSAEQAPNDAERIALAAIDADNDFNIAMAALLAQYDSAFIAFYPELVQEPLPDGTLPPPPPGIRDLAPELQAHLRELGSGAERHLQWNGPAPTDSERLLLQNAIAALPAQSALRGALLDLLVQIDRPKHVPMVPKKPRPPQTALPETIRGQLLIERRRVTWNGRVKTILAWRHLQELAAQATFDDEFTIAVQAIIAALVQGPEPLPIMLPKRPQQSELGDTALWLLIGRSMICYHGLMTADEAHSLQQRYPTSAEQQAIERLYQQTLHKGMRGRELRIRALRQNAPPSEARVIEIASLSDQADQANHGGL